MAQNGAERSESDEEEFKNLSEGIKTNIQTLVQTLTKIQMMISKLDSTKVKKIELAVSNSNKNIRNLF